MGNLLIKFALKKKGRGEHKHFVRLIMKKASEKRNNPNNEFTFLFFTSVTKSTIVQFLCMQK